MLEKVANYILEKLGKYVKEQYGQVFPKSLIG
jgi:hypothetical protein